MWSRPTGSRHIDDPRSGFSIDIQAAGYPALPKTNIQGAYSGAVFFDVDAVADHSSSLRICFECGQFGRDVGALGSRWRHRRVYDAVAVAARVPGGCSSPSAMVTCASSTAAEKWIAERRPFRRRRGTPKPKISARASMTACPQHRADGCQSRQRARAGDRRAPAHVSPGPFPSRDPPCVPATSRSRNVPYADLFDADRRNEAARRIAQGFTTVVSIWRNRS